jgi:DNA-binding response OmpR family regulator
VPFLRHGMVVVWPAQRAARVRGRRVALTGGDGAMLEAMIAARGEPVSRAALAAECGRVGRRPAERAVDARISALRKKLGELSGDPRLIVTVGRVGYAIPVDVVVEDVEGAGLTSRAGDGAADAPAG